MSATPPAPAPAPQQETVYISFSAEINPNTTEALIAALFDCVRRGFKTIYLALSTPGGSVMHGITLYNTLLGLPVHLITHNVGNVDSIGNVIFLAGKTRYASRHSTFMFHGVGFDAPGNMRFEEKLLRERLVGILGDQKRIGEIIALHTSIPPKTARGLFREARTKDANAALAAGIVHEVRDLQIPAGAPVLSLVFQR